MTTTLRSTVAAAALLLALPGIAYAAPTAEEVCDLIAAHPLDRDKPAMVKGSYNIPKKELEAGFEACKAASAKADANRRFVFQLGRLHEFGRDNTAAADRYLAAARAGSTSAMVGLGMLLINGNGVKKDEAEARKWFEKAANDGDVVAMSNLGSIYGAGMGVRADFAKSRAWFEKAANLNYNEAMFQLGLMRQDGDGGKKDPKAAKAWFEKAAALEHANAIYMLGEYAEQGTAGPRDQKAAIDYYRKAAALGDSDAEDALKRLRCPLSLKDKDGKQAGMICFDAGGK
jgi:TPR repeat protein